MSLFPAYAEANKNYVTSDEIKFNDNWLSNPSFNVNVTNTSSTTSQASCNKIKTSDNVWSSESTSEYEESTEEISKSKKKRSRKKKKVSKEPTKLPKINIVDELFLIDTKRTPELLTVDKIYRPSAPKCTVKYYIKDRKRTFRRRKFKRYFHKSFEKREYKSDEESNKITKDDLNKQIYINKDENFKGFKHEEDMTRMTANYNRALAENPTDIDMWIMYARFQDTVFQFEKAYRKGSIAKGQRVTAERKLAILDKALTHNPDCEKLLRERLNIAVSVYPADELQKQLEKLVEKEPGNIILWQGYIESVQCSMSHCSTPKVLAVYVKCLSTLHKLRRNAKIEKHILEEYILRILYQCGLFLRQAGLFEQLWTLLKLYLELNLSQTNFKMGSSFVEKQLLDLEDVILNSQLPIHELWLRIEKLRESCHWLPYTGNESCEDPQRLVFSEDVAELIHPITMPGNTFKLITTILSLLKVPLLPCRHTSMSELGLDYVPWALDSIETLLPMFLPLHPIDMDINLLKYTQKLAVGPQYLKTLPCQEEYLEFVLKIMQNCADSLQGQEKVAVVIWWFRFIRLLVSLESDESFKMTENFKKKLKSNVKSTLKKEEFRNNPIFFQEYALFEYQTGKSESGINILLTTIEMNYKNKCVVTISDEERPAFCQTYRTLIEMHLSCKADIQNNNQKALKYLISFALGKSVNSAMNFITQGSIQETSIKLKHLYSLLMTKDLEKLNVVEHFVPNFYTDFIMCYGWFIYLTKGAIECGTFLENTLDTLNEKKTDILWQKEVLFEFYVTILFKDCLQKPGTGVFKILHDVLLRSIQLYPNNLYLLTVFLKEQTLSRSLSQQWWRIKEIFFKMGHALPVLFLVLILNQHMDDIERTQVDTVTGQKITVDGNLKNRIHSLFRQITSSEMCTKRCSLIWRLYLQFLHVFFDPKRCRDAYYAAVEELPWLKALYIDAAIYIPAELAQIQDLIMEKELRIHVTPEELEVLRN